MRVIGLAGRPGCGKSAVLEELAGRPGVEAIDLDRLAWEIYAPKLPAYERLVARFGPGIVADDGEIDRGKLARVAFATRTSRNDLEAIVHPAVIDRLQHLTQDAQRRGVRLLLVEGALLASSSHVDRVGFDAIVWLEASEETRRNRLRKNDREHHIDRMDDVRPDAATTVVDAEGSLGDVVARVWQAIQP